MIFKREFVTLFIYFDWTTDYGTEIEVTSKGFVFHFTTQIISKIFKKKQELVARRMRYLEVYYIGVSKNFQNFHRLSLILHF